MISLDTHILVYLVTGELKKQERELISGESLAISSIVLWEIAKLHKIRRVQFDLNDRQIQNELSLIQVLPINAEVAYQSCNLDFESDPADEIIAATSICHNIPLLTRDKKIRASKLVPLA